MGKSIQIVFDSVQKTDVKKGIARFFGFTRTGTSLLGKLVRKIHARFEPRKIFGLGLFIAGLSIVTYAGTRNIGGNPGLNLDVINPPVVDASTLDAVQNPITYTYESQGFSFVHGGVDLAAPTGSSIKPIMIGTVKEAGESGMGYGNWVVVEHDQKYESLYGHLSEVEVKPGDKVTLDSELGKSGSTGWSTGPHLHLEVKYQGVNINPAEIVPNVQ